MSDPTLPPAVLLDDSVHPVQARAQQEIISLLHTYQGGETTWAIHFSEPNSCERCIRFSQKLMEIMGVWPSD